MSFWLLSEEEAEKAMEDYRATCSSTDYIRLGRGHCEDTAPAVALAELRKVALIFQECAVVSGSPAMVKIPLEVIRKLYEEAGLIPEQGDGCSVGN